MSSHANQERNSESKSHLHFQKRTNDSWRLPWSDNLPAIGTTPMCLMCLTGSMISEIVLKPPNSVIRCKLWHLHPLCDVLCYMVRFSVSSHAKPQPLNSCFDLTLKAGVRELGSDCMNGKPGRNKRMQKAGWKGTPFKC